MRAGAPGAAYHLPAAGSCCCCLLLPGGGGGAAAAACCLLLLPLPPLTSRGGQRHQRFRSRAVACGWQVTDWPLRPTERVSTAFALWRHGPYEERMETFPRSPWGDEGEGDMDEEYSDEETVVFVQ